MVYALFGGFIYLLLFNQLDVMLKIAVFIYMLALPGMAVMALNRFLLVGKAGF